MADTAVLLISCPDQHGLVARLANFVFERGGNITDLDEHVDPDEQKFALRIAFDLAGFSLSKAQLEAAISALAAEINADWSLNYLQNKQRVAIFVSKYDHCLLELLWRYQQQEFPIEIPLIVSNHDDLRPIAEQYGIDFHVFNINKDNKAEQEQAEIELLEQYQIDTVILARYMQILSPQFISAFEHRIINIHHSFLPAFIGGNPYQQAFDRGVKIIGATSHFVTNELDEGPIIEQDIVRISHKDTVEDLKRKGRDLERLVLARALRAYSQHRVLIQGKRTLVFE
ncbi:formyltetrahydrofolate deformylase [Paraferrimonas sp. SM1919]|uniref:formyltetrahydrofolate deformylase n=1 Tax=Paraferrimonas sp. SM1919 TaxID=2662263 RepID=UPI0013D098FD|nr:formyltetrahydrofolate deformylase [Paraferrimonas sp. SM1919]